MLGAIAGDCIGSIYEFHNTKDYDFTLFTSKSNFTDDSVMTFAVADWLLHDKEHSLQGLEDTMIHYGQAYPNPTGGYGGGFQTWLFFPEWLRNYDYRYGQAPYTSETGRHPYGSWGNGSAMRVSPVGWFFDSLEETERVAAISAEITHNHPEGIKGAQATAAAIWMARHGYSKEEIRSYIEDKYGYDLHKTWEYWHPIYRWDSSCQGTVPQAIICFLDSANFEDAIRKAVSLAGDSDTMACITGGIAEAFYGGVPEKIAKKTIFCLPNPCIDLLETFKKRTDYGKEFPTEKPQTLDDATKKMLTLWKMGLGNSAKRFSGEDPAPEKNVIATKDSWKTLSMPEENLTVPMDLRLTDEQMGTILRGHIPEAMEDHWFMYCGDNHIRYYRSWTGFCIFEAAFEESYSGFKVSSLTINQNPDQFRAVPEKATALFCALLMEECGGDAEQYWKQYLATE